MNIPTGKTVYEDILSMDADNNPVSGATFDIAIIRDGSTYTGLTPSISISDASRGIFSISWSSDTIGSYQMYIKNNITGVIFISDPVIISPDSAFDQNVYIGL